MAYDLEGYAELTKQLRALASPKEMNAALKASVRQPMKEVMKKAATGLGRISPGQREIHRTYKGRLVTRGFAARSLRMIVTRVKNGAVSAVLGVRKEAFYALQFFELGTSKISAQPWLQPAFYQSREQQIKGVGEVLKDKIESIAAKRGGA